MTEFEGLNVLVVDDSVVQRNHVKEVCERFSIAHIGEAVNGQDAVEKMTQTRYDIAFIDLEMPVMDGVELVRVIADQKLVESVIILSSKDPVLILSVGTMAESAGLGVIGTFQKPIQTEQLENSLRRLTSEVAVEADDDGKPELGPEELLEGMAQNQLTLMYQPKLQVKGLLLKGVEALARWDHPELGVVSPGQFIQMAERFGLISKLTDYLFKLALRDKKRWHSFGLSVDLAFNLSPLSISDRGLADHVFDLVSSHELPPGEIILEITENAVAGELSAAIETLAKLRLKGFKIAIDDYGTGFANTQQLSRVPATELKLDRSMIDKVSTRPQNQAIVKSTLQLANDLGLTTVAEGVESIEDFRFLQQHGVEQIQGFLLARPMRADALLEWLKKDLGSVRASVMKGGSRSAS